MAPGTILLATLLLAVGMWLSLPRSRDALRWPGGALVVVSLGLLAWQLPSLGNWADETVFYILAAITVLSAVATVTFRNPVYSAIWFAISLMGTAGLFLFDAAQFLGVATIVVYAGAILVTFLFVLMLAQPEGQAACDRVSWAPLLAAVTGAAVIGLLVLLMVGVFNPAEGHPHAPITAPFATAQLKGEILANQHMAHLGARLFSTHLVAVEVAGTLLLIALVGTVAIVTQMRKPGGPPQ